MITTILLLTIIILLSLLVARPFMKGAFRPLLLAGSLENFTSQSHAQTPKMVPSCWKFDPLEEKILLMLMQKNRQGISVSDLNKLLNVEGKTAENQRQRRHLVVKELNTKLFVLFNIRECIARIPDPLDSRKKQYVIQVSREIGTELSLHLSHARV